MSFTEDIFISYAQIDNKSLIEGQKGWITNLHRALEIRVAQLRGKSPRILRDSKIQDDDYVAAGFARRLNEVALLVSVLTPRYVESEWCGRQVEEFVKASKANAGLELEDRSRVFKVIKTPVPRERHPEELQRLLGYEFFVRDPASGRTRELDMVFGDQFGRDYWAKVDDLAHDICDQLRRLDAAGGAEAGVSVSNGPVSNEPVSNEPVSNEPVSNGSVSNEPVSNGSVSNEPVSNEPVLKGSVLTEAVAADPVYLAETTFDLTPARENVRRDLMRKGFRVLPEEPLPLFLPELEERIAQDLARCQLSVHLVGQAFGVIPEGSTASLVEVQNELAIAREGLPRLVWMPPELALDDPRQSAFIGRLRTDVRLQAGADILETPLEELKSTIYRTLEPEEDSAVDESGVAPTEEEDRWVRIYLVCDQRDLGATSELEDHLFDLGYEVILPVFEGDEAQVREEHEETLCSCDAVVIYYGAGNELWLRRKLREIQRSPGLGRTLPLVAQAIYVAAPRTPQKARLRTRQAVVIEGGASFAPEPLAPLIDRLRDWKQAR